MKTGVTAQEGGEGQELGPSHRGASRKNDRTVSVSFILLALGRPPCHRGRDPAALKQSGIQAIKQPEPQVPQHRTAGLPARSARGPNRHVPGSAPHRGLHAHLVRQAADGSTALPHLRAVTITCHTPICVTEPTRNYNHCSECRDCFRWSHRCSSPEPQFPSVCASVWGTTLWPPALSVAMNSLPVCVCSGCLPAAVISEGHFYRG